ncbi:hypothetical protein [Scytonema sp. UIC 10036]|nr:hypothetical protein [Scytonema sp. UIC 10036]
MDNSVSDETFPFRVATAEVRVLHQKSTMVFTVAYVMNKQSEHKAEAWN